ncbi:hypothetical protein EGM51_01370 [Verrucomicrobia bacterium S94]|nr:hypothetical protein EGM51_01370 [Verrucomicrobia bacterium S94]
MEDVVMGAFFRRYALLMFVMVITIGCMIAAIQTFLAINVPQEKPPVFDNRGMAEPETAPEPPARRWEPDYTESRPEGSELR